MNEEQAKQWLFNNGHYKEFDRPAGEGFLPEASYLIDQEHIEIVMALTKEMGK